jgi:DNA-directed RNA polymerase specialized sigma24 family protein
VMGCAPGTVKALVFQALRNMRKNVPSDNHSEP